MITHTSDPHQIPSQNKTKSKLQIKKNAKNSNFKILHGTLHATYLLKLLDKMDKYEMDPIRTVGTTDRTRDVRQTDGWMDGRIEWNQYTPPPPPSLCRGYNDHLITLYVVISFLGPNLLQLICGNSQKSRHNMIILEYDKLSQKWTQNYMN